MAIVDAINVQSVQMSPEQNQSMGVKLLKTLEKVAGMSEVMNMAGILSHRWKRLGNKGLQRFHYCYNFGYDGTKMNHRMVPKLSYCMRRENREDGYRNLGGGGVSLTRDLNEKLGTPPFLVPVVPSFIDKYVATGFAHAKWNTL